MARISQCMIVKNEEKNIKRALEWAKEIAFEQIVVDTGSTDRTVEIAKGMGAVVYHFDWINDFAAAKNYAIERAHGDWIAFLDADEYFTLEDARKLDFILDTIEKEAYSKTEWRCDAIESAWLQLDHKGKIFLIGKQIRIFKNTPNIRYVGQIHENLKALDGSALVKVDMSQELSIFHTGYAWTADKKKTKSERNIELIEKELEREPDNSHMALYMAEALDIADREEACLRFAKLAVANKDQRLSKKRCADAYQLILYQFAFSKKYVAEDEFKFWYEKAVDFDSERPDFDAAAGFWYYKNKNAEKARYHHLAALEKAEKDGSLLHSKIPGCVERIYEEIASASSFLGDDQNVIYYGTLSLAVNPYKEHILKAVLGRFLYKEAASMKDIMNFLLKKYDVKKEKDILFLIKVAKLLKSTELEEELKQYLSPEQLQLLYPQKKSLKPERKLVTGVDHDFYTWIDTIYNSSLATLQEQMHQYLKDIFLNDRENYGKIAVNYNYWKFWGEIGEEKNTVITERSEVLKERILDWVWLYERLADHRSKKTLLGLMEHWITFSGDTLLHIHDMMGCQYFEPDIFLPDGEECVVDLGAYVGDTYDNYIRVYGENTFASYYCYEADGENARRLREKFADHPAVIVKECAVMDKNGTVQFETNASFQSAGKVAADVGEKAYIQIPAVSLDDDVTEKITLLKMDIEGAELRALKGAQKHIVEEHPKLAVSVYHSNTDILDIPRYIDGLYSGYRFYLRYYGGTIYPSEYVLIAVDEKDR